MRRERPERGATIVEYALLVALFALGTLAAVEFLQDTAEKKTQQSADAMDAYERLISDALNGDSSLFARQDEVEAAWAIVEPVLGTEAPLHEYLPGSWGPDEAEDLILGACGWHDPGVDARSWTRSCGKKRSARQSP